jgi:hypothetical protein
VDRQSANQRAKPSNRKGREGREENLSKSDHGLPSIVQAPGKQKLLTAKDAKYAENAEM